MLINEAIRDVEETTAAPTKLRALPSTMQGAQKTPMFNEASLNFQQRKI